MLYLSFIEPENVNSDFFSPNIYNNNNLKQHVINSENSRYLTAYDIDISNLEKTSLMHLIKRRCIENALNNLYHLSLKEIEYLNLEKYTTSVVSYFIGVVSLYLYEIKKSRIKFFDINNVMGKQSPNPDRVEQAIDKKIPINNISGFTRVDMHFPSGRIVVNRTQDFSTRVLKGIVKEKNKEKSQLHLFKKEISKYSKKTEFNEITLAKYPLQVVILKSLLQKRKNIGNKTTTATKIRYLLNQTKFNSLKQKVTPSYEEALKYRHLRAYALGLNQSYHTSFTALDSALEKKFKKVTPKKGAVFIRSFDEITTLVRARNPKCIDDITTNLAYKGITKKRGASRDVYIVKSEGLGFKLFYIKHSTWKENTTLNLDLRLDEVYKSTKFYGGRYSHLGQNETLFVEGKFVSVFYFIENAIPLTDMHKIPESVVQMMSDAGFPSADFKGSNFAAVPNEYGLWDYVPIDSKFIGKIRSDSLRTSDVNHYYNSIPGWYEMAKLSRLDTKAPISTKNPFR